jgi:hypothetical protein
VTQNYTHPEHTPDMEGPHEAAILLEGHGQGVLLRIRLELLDKQRGRHPAEFHRPDDPQHVVPPIQNPLTIDPVGDLGLEAWIALHVDGTGGKETPVAEVAEAWGEAIPQEIKEGKDDLGIYMDTCKEAGAPPQPTSTAALTLPFRSALSCKTEARMRDASPGNPARRQVAKHGLSFVSAPSFVHITVAPAVSVVCSRMGNSVSLLQSSSST